MRRRAELSREQILKLVADKKSRVGGGYLTDQGALFLVASDMGESLRIEEAGFTLADLEGGQSDVSIIARILSIGPPKKFVRKSDSSTGFVSKLLAYDASSTVQVSIWNPKALADLLRSGVRPGSLIKISRAYTRENLDGSVTLNLSDYGQIDKLSDSNSPSEIPKIEDKTVRNTKSYAKGPLAISGQIRGSAKSSEFAKKDGSKGRLTSFGFTIDGSDTEVRIVVWENPNPVFDNLRDGEHITLLGVGAKESDFQGNKLLEFHGNEATCILEKWDQTVDWLGKSAEEIKSGNDMDEVAREKPQVNPLVARILSIGEEKEKGSAHLLICDSAKRRISVTALKEAVVELSGLEIDNVMIFRPDSIDLIGSKAICSKSGSLLKVRSERKDIPDSASLLQEIEKLTPSSIASLDVMSLSESSSREVQTKEGLVRRSELTIGDPTGDLKVYAWRGLSKLLDGIPAGLRLKFDAVQVQSHDGKKFVVVKNYSRVKIVGDNAMIGSARQSLAGSKVKQ